ncbi:hypothetical protein QJQ45_013984 [Haematococcus lacustris]|nr:hypothetical protein QJQ45_013984 [Haematococcus lacustris]
MMAKKKRKGTNKQKKGPAKRLKASRSPQGKQRQERRNGWETKRRQVIKVLGGAVLRGCKKTKHLLRPAWSQQRDQPVRGLMWCPVIKVLGGAVLRGCKKTKHLLRPAWSQQRDQPVRGLMWCPVLAPCKPPQAPCSSQAATPAAASEPGPSTPPLAKRSKRIEAEQAAKPNRARARLPKPSQHHSQAGGWTGTAMQR